ncbi:MAG: hypothetical protein LHV69_05885 [Elusimicrobia bacterium]|nr:hypothetical protein [Candidatus Obscuribacterium magneticum]
MIRHSPRLYRGLLIGFGVGFILIGCLIGLMSLWEAFVGVRGEIKVVDLPGFHELKFKNPGLYAGLYQHRSKAPLPVNALEKLDVHLMTKDTYEEIPVIPVNQTFTRLGMPMMILFNFVIQNPGGYSLSGVYAGDVEGPTVPVVLVSQTVRNIKPTLIVGGLFFVLFLGLGIFVLVKVKEWAPTPSRTAPA